MTEPKHGTVACYGHGCRCLECRKAKREYTLTRTKQLQEMTVPSQVHGTANGYRHYGCRCPRCHQAKLQLDRDSATRARLRLRMGELAVPEHVHGTRNGYNRYSCRCERCLAAEKSYYHERIRKGKL